MDLLQAWLLFPLVLLALAYGCGRIVEALAGARLDRPLLLPVGTAAIVATAGLLTAWAPLAKLATPAVVGLAAAGFGLAVTTRDGARRPELPASLAAIVTFAAYAAPVVLSGAATFTGMIKLDDIATFLAFTDQVMENGRDLAGLAPSTHEAALALNLDYGYPVGTFLPLGIGATLAGSDPAWVFQPCEAFYAAMLALALYALLSRLGLPRWYRAAAAALAAQAALLYGYSLWGGIKEVAAAGLIALLAATCPLDRDGLISARRLLPLAVGVAATLGVLSVSGALWVAPFLLPLAAIVLRHLSRASLRALAGFAVAGTALSVPSLVIARQFYELTQSNIFTPDQRLGNLVRPLRLVQILGIWPAGDFRYPPQHTIVTGVVLALVVLAVLLGAAQAARRRAWRLPLYAATVVVAAIVLDLTTSPWIAAKGYATAAPAMLALAAAGPFFVGGRLRAVALVVVSVIGAGVLWSNALGYHAVWLAPRGGLDELETIGEQFAGRGPALMTEYQVYGVRHFLRRLDPEGASELRRRIVPLDDGTTLDKAAYIDVDRFALPDLYLYRTLVLRRSPVSSRPPSGYALAWRGRYYEVWERVRMPATLGRLPLGGWFDAAGVARCIDIEALAKKAQGQNGVLVAAPHAPATTALLSELETPPGWIADPIRGTLTPSSAGTVSTTMSVRAPGRYEVWLGGSTRHRVTISIDGQVVATARRLLTYTSQWTPLATVKLTAGRHAVELRYAAASLRPGEGGEAFAFGPLALAPIAAALEPYVVAPADAKQLCGLRLDWIEATRR
ncbi:MAG: hypothetical protein U0R50_14935 [Gaiellales bacterium]